MWVVLLLIQKQFSLCYSCRVVFLLYLSIWNQNDRCEPHNFLKWHIVFGSWWQKHQQHCCKIQLQHFTNKRIFLAKMKHDVECRCRIPIEIYVRLLVNLCSTAFEKKWSAAGCQNRHLTLLFFCTNTNFACSHSTYSENRFVCCYRFWKHVVKRSIENWHFNTMFRNWPNF